MAFKRLTLKILYDSALQYVMEKWAEKYLLLEKHTIFISFRNEFSRTHTFHPIRVGSAYALIPDNILVTCKTAVIWETSVVPRRSEGQKNQQ